MSTVPPGWRAGEVDMDPELDVVDMAHRALHSGWLWVAVWLLSRAMMLRAWGLHFRFIGNDVRYYFGQLGQGTYQVTLREYPLPVLWFLDLLRWPTGGDISLYMVVFGVTMALLDAAFAFWLWRAHSQLAAVYWIAFCFAIGPLVWFRYDILPGVVVGAAVLHIARRPAVSGALVAAGAAIKLWPALLITPLLGRDLPSRRRLTGFGIAGAALALLSLLDSGWTRLVSPLTWQGDRGLQIESVWATPLMVQRAFSGHPATSVQMSKFNAFELFGPDVEAWQAAADLSMVVGVAFAGLVAVLGLTRPALRADQRALACSAIVTVMLVTNKTLSPQYLVWLGAVTAAWLALTPRGDARLRPAIVCFVSLLTAFATQYVYPKAYSGLISNPTGAPGVTTVLALRNLALLGLAVVQAWWCLSDHASNKG